MSAPAPRTVYVSFSKSMSPRKPTLPTSSDHHSRLASCTKGALTIATRLRVDGSWLVTAAPASASPLGKLVVPSGRHEELHSSAVTTPFLRTSRSAPQNGP